MIIFKWSKAKLADPSLSICHIGMLSLWRFVETHPRNAKRTIARSKVHIPERDVNTRFVTRAEIPRESLENRGQPVNAVLYTCGSPQNEEPQTPQAGVVSPADVKHRPRRRRCRRRQRRRRRERCWNTTGKSSVLRFYLHKMIGLTTSRSKRRPRWFSLRILLFPDTRSLTSFRSVAFRFRGNNTATTVIKSDANEREEKNIPREEIPNTNLSLLTCRTIEQNLSASFERSEEERNCE